MERKARAEELVRQALELSPDRRQAFLDNSCVGLPVLREEAEALLKKRSASLEFDRTRALDSSGIPPQGPATTPRVAFRDSDHFGKYEILGVIGSGGFGVVYKGRDPVLKRTVAVKICTSEKQAVRQRFFREAEIAAGLQHPNITTVHDLGFQNDVPYMVQEFLTGDDLDSLVARQDLRSLVQRLEVLQQIAQGLAYAHREGILHRDVKPGNIRVLRNGRVKIMDFGIARPLDDQMNLTSEGIAVGTIGYLAPEQLSGAPADTRVDIFSFGVVAYEVLTGQRPFHGETVSQIAALILHAEPKPLCSLASECPEALGDLVHRCLEKDAAQRFGTFEEVIEVLEIVAQEVATGSHRLTGSGAFRDNFADRRPSGASSAAAPISSAAASTQTEVDDSQRGRGGLAWALPATAVLVLIVSAFLLFSWLSPRGPARESELADAGASGIENPGTGDAGAKPPGLSVPDDVPGTEEPGADASRELSREDSSMRRDAAESSASGAAPGAAANRDEVDPDEVAPPATRPGGGLPVRESTEGAPRSAGIETASQGDEQVAGTEGRESLLEDPEEEGGAGAADVSSALAGEGDSEPSGLGQESEEPLSGSREAGVAAEPAASATSPITAPPPSLSSSTQSDGTATSGPTISPMLLDQPAPVYPRQAMRRRKEAEVVILALVDESGKVIRTAIKQNSDELGLGFDEAARTAAQKATFEPAQRAGQPVQAWSEILYVFKRP